MPRLYRYNRDMHPDTAQRLIDINREFYTRFGDSFSATRHRLQPGVRRVLESLRGEESILDLGCGNGELARGLVQRGHRGPYLGVDFSLPLLREAEQQPQGFSAKFLEVDLTRLSGNHVLMKSGPWDVITAFAVLHHIPSNEIRMSILGDIRTLLAPNGRFILSNWQFLKSEKLRARIQPWQAAVVQESDVDPGDYLLDWRNGGAGLRYVHDFGETELSALAQEAGFAIQESFYSDGVSGDLGLYQVWQIEPTY